MGAFDFPGHNCFPATAGQNAEFLFGLLLFSLLTLLGLLDNCYFRRRNKVPSRFFTGQNSNKNANLIPSEAVFPYGSDGGHARRGRPWSKSNNMNHKSAIKRDLKKSKPEPRTPSQEVANSIHNHQRNL